MGKDKIDRRRTKEAREYMSAFRFYGKPEHLTAQQYQQRVHKQQNVYWHQDHKPPPPPPPPPPSSSHSAPPPPSSSQSAPPPPSSSQSAPKPTAHPQRQLSPNSAIIVILAHGVLQTSIDGTESNYTHVPRSILHFKKKNVAACGYLSMLDLYYRRSLVDIIRGIIRYGLDASFPTIQDVRNERRQQQNDRQYHTSRTPLKHPPGYATDRWGNSAVRGKCRTGICHVNEERTLITKTFSPEIHETSHIRLPIAFYYGKSTKIYDLFKNDDLIELLHAGSTAENAEEIIAIIRTLMPPGEEEEYTSKLTTDIILKIAELIGITNLSILDFSCAASEESGFYDKLSLFVQPPGEKYGGRPKSRRKNKKYKPRGTRKTKNI